LALCNHSVELTGLAGRPASPVHRLDPRAKVLGVVGITVVAVSTPLSAWPAFVACALCLVVLAAVARVPPGVIWRRARVVLPLVAFVAIFLPFFRHGGSLYHVGPFTLSEVGIETFLTVTIKATIGTVSAVLLGATTSFPDVLRALELMRVPRLFTLIAAFMYRYLFVIVEEVARMRVALASRGYRPRHALQASAIGRVVTALFLRTYTRGERVYLAMLSRGYRGQMPEIRTFSFATVDALFLTLLLAGLVSVRIAAGVGS
jgi:cobalt/nickel transport system permease protein